MSIKVNASSFDISDSQKKNKTKQAKPRKPQNKPKPQNKGVVIVQWI